jgi:hypothetical protein
MATALLLLKVRAHSTNTYQVYLRIIYINNFCRSAVDNLEIFHGPQYSLGWGTLLGYDG